jgi:uncharacterized membrane protein
VDKSIERLAQSNRQEVPVALKVWEVVSILLSALVMGVFWGPWLALSRSIAKFAPEAFLAIGYRLNVNLAPVMTVLMPATLLSLLPVMLLSYHLRPNTFYLTLAGFGLFLIALLVTVLVEVPIANQIKLWTIATLPANWEQLRDRWQTFHIVRVVTSIAGLACLLIGAIF